MSDELYSYTQAAREIAEAQGWDETVKSKFTENLLKAITRDQLKTRNRVTGLPLENHTTDVLWHFVTEDDVNHWLKWQGVSYQWHPQKSTSVEAVGVSGITQTGLASIQTDTPKESAPIANWKMQIQTEATAYCLRLKKAGANPTKRSILGSMTKWCQENDIKTDGKIFPSENYLRTHVLGGKHWALPY